MSWTITFEALSGVMDESPPCYILQVNKIKILLDCGLDKNFDVELLPKLKQHVHTIDAVLISHPDIAHLGALPYLVKKLGLNCPIYATIPVCAMGQMFLYDFHQSYQDMEDFNLFSLDDIDATFSKIHQVQFNQTIFLEEKCYGLTVTALRAGRTMGGTIWKVGIYGDEDVIYANDFNYKRDRIVNGCDFTHLQRPSVVILGASNSSSSQTSVKQRDEMLLTNILQTLNNNGNVLIPADSAGRVLELTYMLNQLWDSCQSYLSNFSLVRLSNVSSRVVEFGKSHIEWMSDNIVKNMEDAKENPFRFKHLRLCSSMEELDEIPNQKVVIASSADMESGFSREVFLKWCSGFNNRIIVTTKSSPGTLARDLVDNDTKRTLDIVVKKRVQLEGIEMEEYVMKSSLSTSYQMESDSDDDEMMRRIVSKVHHDIISKPGEASFSGTSNPQLTFPYHESIIEWDEYGEIINIDDYRGSVKGIEENIKKPKEEVFDTSTLSVVPTKCITTHRNVTVNACVDYIDFEGRSDENSVHKILSQLNPRRIIIVKGTPEDTSVTVKYCQEKLNSEVFAPSQGEIIDIRSDTNIFHMRLTDALISQLKFKTFGNAEIAWVSSLKFSKCNMECLGVDNEPMIVEDDVLTLEPLTHPVVQPQDIGFAGHLKLSNFKQILSQEGIFSEFSDGILWCSNATIAIQRTENGNLFMQGSLSENYYKIRNLLYEYNATL